MSDSWHTRDQVKAGATGAAWYVWIMAIILAVSVAGGVLYYSVYQPYQINQENANIRNSIGYTQRANEQCLGDIAKYNDRDATSGQKAQSVTDCKNALIGVRPENVDPSVAQFVATH